MVHDLHLASFLSFHWRNSSHDWFSSMASFFQTGICRSIYIITTDGKTYLPILKNNTHWLRIHTQVHGGGMPKYSCEVIKGLGTSVSNIPSDNFLQLKREHLGSFYKGCTPIKGFGCKSGGGTSRYTLRRHTQPVA